MTYTLSSPDHIHTAMEAVQQASWMLAGVSAERRSRVLEAMAAGLKAALDDILEANTLDLEASREMAVPDLVLDWLKLTPERLQVTIRILQRLAALGDLTPRAMESACGHSNSFSYSQLSPLGVVALVYESLPELSAIAAGLCLRTGNALILKGSSDASQSNQAIVQVLQDAIAAADLPEHSLMFFPADRGDTLRSLVTQTQFLNLVIPYGRPSWVQQVVRQATVPVLPATMGNCYLYWGLSGSVDLVLEALISSHDGQPDPINGIEKVIVHESHAGVMLTRLWSRLREEGFEIRGDKALVEQYPDLTLAEPEEWRSPYLHNVIAFRQAPSLTDAIDWINAHTSGHADCIITDAYDESRQFARGVQSASIHVNASPRFSRNPGRSRAIALGMSSYRRTPGGLIGLDALTTLKHVHLG